LPPDLSTYDVIWHVGLRPIGPADRARLVAFVEAGGGLHLGATHSSHEVTRRLNDSLQSIVRALVAEPEGSEVVIEHPGSPPAPVVLTSRLTGDSNESGSVVVPVDGSGGLGGIPVDQTFAVARDGTVVGACWSEADLKHGAGRLTVLADQDWVQREGAEPVIRVISRFLRRTQPADVSDP
jgi:hypothetical protein